MSYRFEITQADSRKFVGLEIERGPEIGGIFVHQRGYLQTVLERFGMRNCRPVTTPMEKGSMLGDGARCGPGVPFREAIGALMFLAIGTKPDITQAVGFLSRFLENHDSSHWTGVLRVLRYLRGTQDHGLLYWGDLSEVEIEVWDSEAELNL